jgi:hypothetical protein
MTPYEKALEAAAIAFCQSCGKVNGVCAVACLDQLGNAPVQGCRYATKVHGKNLKSAIAAYLAAMKAEGVELWNGLEQEMDDV